jgi:hypothetical protein
VSRIWLSASTILTLEFACSHGMPAALARRTSSAGVHRKAVETSGTPFTRSFCVAPPNVGCSRIGPVGSRSRSSRLSEREPSQVPNIGGKYTQSTASASGVSRGSCTVPLVLLSDGSGWLALNHSELVAAAALAGVAAWQAPRPVELSTL